MLYLTLDLLSNIIFHNGFSKLIKNSYFYEMIIRFAFVIYLTKVRQNYRLINLQKDIFNHKLKNILVFM